MLVGIMARAGYDAVLLDQQHGFHDMTSCKAAIAEVALTGAPVLVRIPVGDFAQAARLLDLGASGILAPMINSTAEAQAFVAHVKYPPLGQRSFGPGRDMQLRNIETAGAYLKFANQGTLALVMCETREALAALDDILAVDGVDGVFMGPGDLSLALSGGRAVDPSTPETKAAMKHIAARARAAGKFACAFADGIATARARIDEGYQLVAVGYDGQVISDAFQAVTGAITEKT